jgi:hypothetical protein
MANAIQVTPSQIQTLRRDDRPSGPSIEAPTCACIDPSTKDRCGRPATRIIAWGGEDNGSRTPACADCADYMTALSHEHKCPGSMSILPIDTTRLH